MGIRRSHRPVAAARLAAIARSLLDASTLCAIATVGRARAYVSTAYFAWTPELELVWLSEPRATHSRNLRANDSVAVAVFDSRQRWGGADRGIQLFGSARRSDRTDVDVAAQVYAARFPRYSAAEVDAYAFYVFHPHRLKLFDERELGAGTFVTARVDRDGAVSWERTEIYHARDRP
jgi:uncharacterized protein YhbP (UPF0306 family)